MRVTENSMMSTVRDSLNRSRYRMEKLQQQNATLKQVNAPSDDPVGNVRLMSIRNETQDSKQFENNANTAQNFINFTDAALEEVTNLVVRAKELTVQAANSAANGPDSRIMVAEEVKHIMSEVLAIANRRLGERHIFSGYKTTTQPFTNDGNYEGDEGKIMIEVQKDVFVPINLSGSDVFLGGPPEYTEEGQAVTSPLDMFRILESLRVGLMTNNVDTIRSALDPLDEIKTRVITSRAQLGTRMQGIDSALANMAKTQNYNAELQSTIEDADLIKTVSELAREETVLRASLQASDKLVQPTLLDFLK